MPCLTTALTRSAIKKSTRKKNKISRNEIFTAKSRRPNLKAHRIFNYTNLLFPNYTADGTFPQ